MDEAVALVVAAGRGERFGAGTPKQYRSLAGRPLLRYGLAALTGHPGIAAVRAVIHMGDLPHYERAAEGLDLLEPVGGGANRQDSVRLGLESLLDLGPERVLIHDGARPLLPRPVIDRVLAGLDQDIGAIAALPVTDTLKRAGSGRITETVARKDLWRAQTPQGFHFKAILEAHRAAAGTELTDDAAVAEQAGLPVRLVAGAPENIKVTGPEDLARVEALLAAAGGARDSRVGSGFDVHRFGPGDHVTLCGIEVPHDQGLLGHSDADVALHALTDALLGALAAGDIGQHFPPSEPRWRDADSAVFLRHARDLVAERGGRIVNVDVTLICEAPKLAPYRDDMSDRVAELLQIEAHRVGVKATTTEGLGFTGRGEGIAAQAVASVSLPGPVA